MRLEGVDYSRTPHDNWSQLAAGLKAAGKQFVGRYAVADKSPDGRGITAAEYQAMKAAGIEVFLYYEEDEAWMLDGWDAGVRAGHRALTEVRNAGMPTQMPVYYSHDIEPESRHYTAIDECLRGAASVVGPAAVGLYGGFNIIEHCSRTRTAQWFAQTWAWSGSGDAWNRNLSSAAHLYQYETRTLFIAGISVDLVAALKSHYGQASDFGVFSPKFPEKPIRAPEKLVWQGHVITKLDKSRFLCIKDGQWKTAPHPDAPDVKRPAYAPNRTYTLPYETIVKGRRWLVANSGSTAPADDFTQR